MENIICQAQICKSYIGNFHQKKDPDTNAVYTNFCMQETLLADINFESKSYRYLYIKNNSSIDIQIVRIEDEKGLSIDLTNWRFQILEAEKALGMFIESFNAPNYIVINYSGWDIKYFIGNCKSGAVAMEMNIPKRQARAK